MKNLYSDCDMEEQIHKNDLQLTPLAINWMPNNASGLFGGYDANQHYIMTPESNCNHPGPSPLPQWMHCVQAPESYDYFLAERGYPEFQKQMSHEFSKQIPSLGIADSSHLEEYLTQHSERNAITAFKGLEYQFGVQKQDGVADRNISVQSHSGATKSKCPSDARRRRSKEKSYAADRCRRLRIAHWLDALQELVPHSKEVGKADLLEYVIEHVKNLQIQMKDLCRSRLACQSTSNSFIFLEGHGHYLVQERMLNGPLEEMIGKLIDVYPSAATELLQSRGLVVMPMNCAEGLVEHMEMLDVQEKVALPISK